MTEYLNMTNYSLRTLRKCALFHVYLLCFCESSSMTRMGFYLCCFLTPPSCCYAAVFTFLQSSLPKHTQLLSQLSSAQQCPLYSQSRLSSDMVLSNLDSTHRGQNFRPKLCQRSPTEYVLIRQSQKALRFLCTFSSMC